MDGTIETKSLTPVERIEQWIAALRSGKYRQGQFRLRLNDRFCCLDVACDVYDASQWKDAELYGEFFADEFPPHFIDAAYGLTHTEVKALSVMNDDDNASFAEIADYIESEILPRVRREQEGQ